VKQPIVTHHVRYDEPGADGRIARAVCGKLVNPKREHSNQPTCQNCQTWLRLYEEMDFGQNDPAVQA
jgi:hypothetical protein